MIYSGRYIDFAALLMGITTGGGAVIGVVLIDWVVVEFKRAQLVAELRKSRRPIKT
jgi:hypothetical protein